MVSLSDCLCVSGGRKKGAAGGYCQNFTSGIRRRDAEFHAERYQTGIFRICHDGSGDSHSFSCSGKTVVSV